MAKPDIDVDLPRPLTGSELLSLTRQERRRRRRKRLESARYQKKVMKEELRRARG